jgi:RNA polymerase sigma factor (sigma-70 family)
VPAGEQVDLTLVPSSVSSFEAFFRTNYAPLVRLLAASADDVEDAVQDAFLQAHLHWSRIGRYEDPKAWVRLVAVRLILNRERGRSRRHKAVERLQGRVPPIQPSTESLSNSELLTQIRRLSPRQRMSVALFYLCDLPITEVATTMGISAGTVKATLASARKSLRMSLEDDDDAQ